MIRTQISMTEQQADGLRRLAAARNRSQAALLRDALDELLENEARVVRIQRARDAIGAWTSEASAASERHDAALADAFAD